MAGDGEHRREERGEALLGHVVGGRHQGDAAVVGRVGDVVLAARDAVAFVDPAMPKEAELRSGHGSLVADEMLVPLVAAHGRAPG